jgi:hypothetical protein
VKYKRIKSALHNLGDSFFGLTNYFHDVYVLDELNELIRRSPTGVVIDLSAGTISPDPGPAKRLREAVAAYRDRLAAHFEGEGLDVARLTEITLHYCPTSRSRGTVSAVDDRGTRHHVPV